MQVKTTKPIYKTWYKQWPSAISPKLTAYYDPKTNKILVKANGYKPKAYMLPLGEL